MAQGTTAADASGKNHPATLLNGVNWRTSQAFTAVAPVDGSVPVAYALDNAYPNPFNPSTTIRFALPFASNVKLVVYNILGQRIATLADGMMAAGQHEVQWHALSDRNLSVSSGIYFYRLEASGSKGERFLDTKKVMLLK